MIDRAWFHYGDLDLERMQEALKLIEGKHNFRAFSRSHTQVKTYECHVMNAHWEVKDSLLVFSITADRFLRNMVRALVGTFIDLGRGKISAADLKNIMESGNRSLAGPSAPAHGLYLHRINYPGSIYLY
jgi:tRNA pseudouridine38-40 synthase